MPPINASLAATPVEFCACARASCSYANVSAATAAADAAANHAQITLKRAVRLTSDSPLFTELSSLVLLSDDQLLAVSDSGYWLRFAAAPTTSAASTVQISPLLGEDGAPLTFPYNDVEGITTWHASGRIFASLERYHRVLEYALASIFSPEGAGAASLGVDAHLAAACGAPGRRSNLGVEALIMLNATHLLTICEGGPGAALSQVRVFDLGGGRGDGGGGGASATLVRSGTYSICRGLSPVDVARAPGGGLLVLERGYDPEQGNTIRLAHLSRAQLDDGWEQPLTPREVALLEPGTHLTDNMEGLATSFEEDGSEARVFLVSDDNDNSAQQTLLYEFVWNVPEMGEPGSGTESGPVETCTPRPPAPPTACARPSWLLQRESLATLLVFGCVPALALYIAHLVWVRQCRRRSGPARRAAAVPWSAGKRVNAPVRKKTSHASSPTSFIGSDVDVFELASNSSPRPRELYVELVE